MCIWWKIVRTRLSIIFLQSGCSWGIRLDKVIIWNDFWIFFVFHSIGKWLVPPTPPKPKPVSQRIQDSLPQQFSLMYWRNNKQFITFIFFLAGIFRANLFKVMWRGFFANDPPWVSLILGWNNKWNCVHTFHYFISHQHRVVRLESLLLQGLQGSDRERTKRFLHVVQVSLHCIYSRCIHPRVLSGW